jgi:hypothetical protein
MIRAQARFIQTRKDIKQGMAECVRGSIHATADRAAATA